MKWALSSFAEALRGCVGVGFTSPLMPRPPHQPAGGMVFAPLLLPPSTFTPSTPSTAMSAMPVLEGWDFICCSRGCCCACGCACVCDGWGCASCISWSLPRLECASSFSNSFSRIAAFPLPRFLAPAPFFFLVSTGAWVAACAEPSAFVMPLDGALKSKDAISAPTRNTNC